MDSLRISVDRRRGRASALSACLAIGSIGVLTDSATAQVPNPNREVHPGIADPAPGGIHSYGSAPKVQLPDGVWNHGEGFVAAPTSADADRGGWFEHDDGTGLTLADIHLYNNRLWMPFTWVNPLHPSNGVTVDRLQGYLRPAGLALPTYHPRYGNVGPYVDNGAFEIYRPTEPYYGVGSGQKILIVILCSATIDSPRVQIGPNDWEAYQWWNTYRGFFSPDGLVRDEFASGGTGAAGFALNDDVTTVQRYQPVPIATWDASGNKTAYYPICGYPALTVSHRQTELNEQRHLQLAQAIKLLLMDPGPRNPIGTQLTAQQVEDLVVVVMEGGSNGGHQASWAALRHPDLVHGCAAQVINPSIQRLFGEQDLGWAFAELSAARDPGATVRQGDFLDWCQYTWNQGLEIRDMSFLRHFFTDQTYRPGLFFVGDEDLTSTGTDWVRVADGSAWTPSGLRPSGRVFGDPAAHRFAWMTAENGCHGGGVAIDPYTGATTARLNDVEHGLFLDAVIHRTKQLSNSQSTPVPAIVPLPDRTDPQQLRGLDDPHEWFLGRPGEPLPAAQPGDPLVRDDAFHDAVSPGAAGTFLGKEESMLIRDLKVYVGSADGTVSSFEVDTTDTRLPLTRVARSQRLGHQSFAMAELDEGSSWSLLVGTRRHLFKLDPVTLAITATSPILPWEVAQPRNMKVVDLLSDHAGDEIVFRSVHGGLVFYDTALQPIHEWPEPGITDFVVQGGMASIVSSRRAVLANVSFPSVGNAPLHGARLHAVSQPLPLTPTDLPMQGSPIDLELMQVNLAGMNFPALVSLWTGDTDGLAIRVHNPTNLSRVPPGPGVMDPAAVLANNGASTFASGGTAIATCREDGANQIGDHLLVLTSDHLLLYDEMMNYVGHKSLAESVGGYYPFGHQAISLAVGNLLPPSGGSTYQEQVVVGTRGGNLMWLNVQDVATPTAGTAWKLPAAYDVQFGPGSNVQPRTNQALAATWSIAVDTSNPNVPPLQLLDQDGAYWRVSDDGTTELLDRTWVARGSKGWARTGQATSRLGSIPVEELVVASGGTVSIAETYPWCPDKSEQVYFEKVAGSSHIPDNWIRGRSFNGTFGSMFPFFQGGAAVADGPATEVWFWSRNLNVRVENEPVTAQQTWPNIVEGMRIDGAGVVDGIWASSGVPATLSSALRGDRAPYHDLRNVIDFVPAMNFQSVQAVKLTSGQTVVVLGCPGGRVRVLLPGAMRTTAAPHGIGSIESTPYDLGFGGGALAASLSTTGPERVHIWFGTLCDPVARPGSYASSTGTLGDGELAVGAVHKIEWTPGSSGSGFTTANNVKTVRLAPSSSAPRGGYGVVGLAVGELLTGAAYSGEELIVTTLSGELIIYRAEDLHEYWRTHVPGAVGVHDSITIQNLDSDPAKNELYIATSSGLYRFVEV